MALKVTYLFHSVYCLLCVVMSHIVVFAVLCSKSGFLKFLVLEVTWAIVMYSYS